MAFSLNFVTQKYSHLELSPDWPHAYKRKRVHNNSQIIKRTNYELGVTNSRLNMPQSVSKRANNKNVMLYNNNKGNSWHRMWAAFHLQFVALALCSPVCMHVCVFVCVTVWCVGEWSARQTSEVPIMKLLTTNWHLQMSHAILSIHKGKLNKKPPSPPPRDTTSCHTQPHTHTSDAVYLV